MDTTIEAAEGAVDALGNVVSRATSAASDAASRAREMGSHLASRASEAGSEAMESISSLGQQAVSTVSSRADSMRRMSSNISPGSRGLEELAQAQPLVFGAVGLAMGAALGAILPRTEAEDRLMGEARESMAERVGEAAREGMDTVRNVAGEHLDRVKDTLAETYQETKENLDRGGLSGVGNALGNAASDVGRVAEDALRGAVNEVKRGIGDTGQRTP
jgi:vacuolar-type H+-ATPase subunit H